MRCLLESWLIWFSLCIDSPSPREELHIRPWSVSWLGSEFQFCDLDTLQSGEQCGDVDLPLVVDDLRCRVRDRSDQIFVIVYAEIGWVLGAVDTRLGSLAIPLRAVEVIVAGVLMKIDKRTLG